MQSLILLIYQVIELYKWILVLSVVASWLVAFNVINTRNRFVHIVIDVLTRLTEPVLRPIRRILPNLGGLDLSPIILYFLLWFLQSLLLEYGLGSPFAIR
jgi:YggT family protein